MQTTITVCKQTRKTFTFLLFDDLAFSCEFFPLFPFPPATDLVFLDERIRIRTTTATTMKS